jgi:predicted metal-dependent enzyme (double-stranded beta helix superfamily)
MRGVEALRPAFQTLLAADGWLPASCAQPDETSRMGAGIGQYALYRAEDGSLCLFSLVVPAGAATPVHDHLAWGLVGVYRGRQDETVYRRLDDGRDPARARLEIARRQTLAPGEFYTLLPPAADIHYVKTVSERHRFRFICSPTIRRACGVTASIRHRAPSRRSDRATRARPARPTKVRS